MPKKTIICFHVTANRTKHDAKEYLDKICNVKIQNAKMRVLDYIQYKSPKPNDPDENTST